MEFSIYSLHEKESSYVFNYKYKVDILIFICFKSTNVLIFSHTLILYHALLKSR
jgi:hypothetical protein